MTSMRPRLSVTYLSPRSPPLPQVQPCLSVLLPEHYSINFEPHKHNVFGFFNVVPAPRLSDGISVSELTFLFEPHRRHTTPCLPAQPTSSRLSIMLPHKALMPTLTSRPLGFLGPRRLPVRMYLLRKLISSKEAQ